MTLLPGSLAIAPAPAPARSSTAPSSRSGDSRDFASALEGALGGAAKQSERRAETAVTAQAAGSGSSDTAATAECAPMAQSALIVPAIVPPVLQGDIMAGDEIFGGGLDGVATAVVDGLGVVLPGAIDAQAAAGSTLTGAEQLPASATELVAAAAAATATTPMPATAAAATGTVSPVQTQGAAAPIAVSTAPVADPQQAQVQAQNTPTLLNPVGATPAVADSAVAGAAVGAAAAPAQTAGMTALASPVDAAIGQPTAVAATGGSADTSGGATDQGQNNSGQLTLPQAGAAPVAQQGVQAPAAAYAAVAASQSDATVHTPLSTQIARPLFSLANAAHGEHVMTISITPDNLGPVTVRAHVGPEGIRVELFAPNDAGRDALRSIMTDLKRDLAGSGMTGASLDLSNRDQAGNSPEQGRQTESAGRARASVSARESADDSAPALERSTVPTWYGGIPSIDVMA